jgi:hypothetical protein
MLASAFDDILRLDQTAPTLPQALAAFRGMSFDTFGELLLTMPNPRLPNLSKLLPAATPDAIQQHWTGSSGDTLLGQSLSFINFLVAEYATQTGRPIGTARVLDFGVGWGRLMRLLAFFVDPPQLFGVDPWQSSLDHALQARVLGNLARSDMMPETLPFAPVPFDLIFAFSVFTHVSASTARKCLAAMRARITPTGLAVISVRPVEIWEFLGNTLGQDYAHLAAVHEKDGMAYTPSEPGGDYGDISMSRAYLEAIAPGWEIVRMGATLVDPFQVFVTLRPV